MTLNHSATDAARQHTVVLYGLVLAGLSAVLCLICLTAPFHYVLALLSDDAFYYFKIVQNIVRGHGSTFDGIVPTNGYHPLWAVCVIPIFYLFDTDPETPVRIVVASSCILSIGSLFLVYRIVQEHAAPDVAWVAVAACLLPNVLSAMLNGMETGLLLFAILVLIRVCYCKPIDDQTAGFKHFVGLGALLGVVTLCRLDAVFITVAAVGLIAVLTGVLRLAIRACLLQILALSLGFSVFVGPYFLWNLVNFGHVMPISGAVKTTFPAIRQTVNLRGDMIYGAYLLGALLSLTVIIATVDMLRGCRLRRILGSPLLMVTLGCTFHFAHALLFLDWGVYWWHFAVYGLALAVAVSQFVHRLTASRPRLRMAVSRSLVVSLVIVACMMKSREMEIRTDRQRGWLAAAQWARAETAPNAVFAIKDAGFFGYFSERRVINLDGKANGYDYREHLIAGDVHGYLDDREVGYIADIAARYTSGQTGIGIPRANRSPVVLRMYVEDEVYRTQPIPRSASRFGPTPMGYFAIWRYPGSRTQS